MRDFCRRAIMIISRMNEEWFDLIDDHGAVIGKARRSVCHGNPGLIHQAVHVLVFNAAGELFLQKRSPQKDIQPGKWDTSVGGHLLPGENARDGARRELQEELGVSVDELTPAYTFRWRSGIESEHITTFTTRHEGPFTLHPEEISEGRFWPLPEIEKQLATGIFTEQFTGEFSRIASLIGSQPV